MSLYMPKDVITRGMLLSLRL
uniref:Uncharacterized protein n=1 Tax=Moniliophthora roreri TaxID=221103 RepID=A0A0W0FYU8_MONRR